MSGKTITFYAGDPILVEIQQKERAMLKALLECFETLHLRYFLLGGSCLGAVRHQGFIPWDDDIDVGMPREDYEAFLKMGQAHLPKPYFLQCSSSDPDCPYCFAKLRDSSTTFVESSVASIKMNHGLFVDVFPLDRYDGNSAYFRKRRFLYCSISKLYPDYGQNDPWPRKAVRGVCRVLVPDYRAARDRIDKLNKAQNAKGGPYMINFEGAWGDKEIFKREIFGSGAKARFEGMDVIVPERYDEFLAQLYGDYMSYPQPERRVSHHYVKEVDMNKSYLEAQNDQTK